MRIRSRLLLYFLSFYTAILVLGLGAQWFTYRVFSTYLYGTVNEIFNSSVSSFTAAVSNLERLSVSILSDRIVQDFLDPKKQKDETYAWRQSRERFIDQLSFYSHTNEYVREVIVADSAGNPYYANIGLFHQTSYDEIIKPEIRRRSESLGGSSVWNQTGSDVLPAVLSRQINMVGEFNHPPLGQLHIFVDVEQLLNETLSQIGYYGLKAGIGYKGDEFYALEGDNTRDLIKDLGSRQYATVVHRGERYFAAYISSGKEWEFLFLIPTAELFFELQRVNRIFYAAFLGLFIIAALLILRASRQLARPIIALSRTMEDIVENNFVRSEIQELPSGTSNEVVLLHKEFNEMLEKIDTLINRNLKQQLSLKQSQLEALSHQLNPHFLYNTLDSVYWMAQMGEQPEIATVIKSLSALLRSSLEKSAALITVKEQLDLLNDYFYIQKIRLKDQLDFHIDIDHRLYECLIPRFTLQPLVENSIKYCLNSSRKVCIVEVAMRREESAGLFIITIRDNGPGYHPETEDPQSTGIGLENLRRRIELIYGEGARLEIGTVDSGGTEVRIVLPTNIAGEDA